MATVSPKGGGVVPWLGGVLQSQVLCILGFKMEAHEDGGGLPCNPHPGQAGPVW